jgi:hypothetical protein
VSNESRSRSAKNPGWFPKGRSGNLKGRPRTSRTSKGSAFEVLVERTITVVDRGGTREMTVEGALQQRTYQDALVGKGMAMREVVKWIVKREAWLAKHEAKAPQPTTFLSSPDPDNADAALQGSGAIGTRTLRREKRLRSSRTAGRDGAAIDAARLGYFSRVDY